MTVLILQSYGIHIYLTHYSYKPGDKQGHLPVTTTIDTYLSLIDALPIRLYQEYIFFAHTREQVQKSRGSWRGISCHRSLYHHLGFSSLAGENGQSHDGNYAGDNTQMGKAAMYGRFHSSHIGLTT